MKDERVTSSTKKINEFCNIFLFLFVLKNYIDLLVRFKIYTCMHIYIYNLFSILYTMFKVTYYCSDCPNHKTNIGCVDNILEDGDVAIHQDHGLYPIKKG